MAHRRRLAVPRDVIAPGPVKGAAHRVDHEAALERFGLDPCVDLERRIKWGFRGPVADQLEDVADVAARHERIVEKRAKLLAASTHVFKKPVFFNDFLYLQGRRRSRWVTI